MAATITMTPLRVSNSADKTDAADVGVAILAAEAETLGKIGADDIAVEQLNLRAVRAATG